MMDKPKIETPFQRLDPFGKLIFLTVAGMGLFFAAVFFVLFILAMLSGFGTVIAGLGVLFSGDEVWRPICLGFEDVGKDWVRYSGSRACSAVVDTPILGSQLWSWNPAIAYAFGTVSLFIAGVLAFVVARLMVFVAVSLGEKW